MRPEPDSAPRARIPSDIDTPDKIVYGLTARQLAILATAAVTGYTIVKATRTLLPMPALIAALVPVAGIAIFLALGRKDGLPIDRWLLAGIRYSRAPRHLTPAATGHVTPPPSWAPLTTPSAPSVLRLPAHAISGTGIIDTGTHATALIACTTVNISLRTGDEQTALIGAYGRWLNGLAAPVQVVISAQRVDLTAHAQHTAEAATAISNPALAEAAHDYAGFLEDLAARRDPLWRTVTIAVTASSGKGRDNDVTRRAEHTASSLAALGVQTAILDGARVTSVLTAATDPYTPSGSSWPRTRPGAIITGGTP